MKRYLAILALFCSAAFGNPGDDLIASVLIKEAAGEGYDGMRAVMAVIVNRSKSEDLLPAIRRPYAFSCMNRIYVEGAMTEETMIFWASEDRVWEAARKIVKSFRENRFQDITQGANHYHSVNIRPYWANPNRITLRIGKHIFYKL